MDTPITALHGSYLAECSNTLGALAEALSSAQAELENVKMDAANPYYRSRYATLAAVVRSTAPVLSKYGLSVTQLPQQTDGTRVSVRTVLLHKSGEYISGILEMIPVKPDPQGIGSCLSYIRRYSWLAICGLGTEESGAGADDDANAATHRREVKTEPVHYNLPETPDEADPATKKFKTAIRIVAEQLEALLKENGIETPALEVHNRMAVMLGSEGFSNISEVRDRDHRKIVYKRWSDALKAAQKFYAKAEPETVGEG